MIYLILTIFSLIFAYFCTQKMNWAVASIVLALPTYLLRFQLFGIPMTVLELMILIIFCVWLVKTWKSKEKIILSNYKWWGLVLLIVATMSIFIAKDTYAALGVWKAYFIEPVLFFIVFINTIKTKKDFSLIIKSLGVVALVVAVPAIVQKFTGWGITNEFWRAAETRRVTSWYGFPNAVGLCLSPIAMIFAGLILRSKIRLFEEFKKTKKIKLNQPDIFYFAVFIFSTLAIIFAETEGALIGLVAGLLILGLIYPYKLTRISTVALILIVLIVGFSVPQIRNYAEQKLTLSDRSGQIRLQQWDETWEMLDTDEGWKGVGLSSYQDRVLPYHEEAIWIQDKNDPDWKKKIQTSEEFRIKMWQPVEIYMYPHNFFLNFWSEIGLIGLLVVLILMIKFWANYYKVTVKENRLIYLILLSVLVVIFIHGQVDVVYLKNDLSIFWWLLFGMSWALIQNKQKLYE